MGNLLIYGIGGSGTTTALRTILLSLAARRSPASVHIYVVDLGAGELAALSALPHTGAHVPAQEGERRMRLLRFLRDGVARPRPPGQIGRAARRERGGTDRILPGGPV